ncbi:exopolyphosphatase [Ameyamaea chiangmaiensis NBRC 103196]|uniref:Ppx/GppA family phosphatase n=1 Tax=Ameyamaea chiangmaiensis TaxID=442969 RepID=A0A850P7F1_9PROT|nr:Ppx/GppA family phosphatase [Ameyamaea chiangmaiensis]MBS4074090.1 Ppx/GppA family phosphatase [Ameyamaea chiangmaiensis]NVN40535.1 Ppx/GppA family phosphatase [Ameyamaea chiangmaiensis]GBQ67279.1 exopolyphosphatase [Ameyamaea chiangmaiensis NBRC 103196]
MNTLAVRRSAVVDLGSNSVRLVVFEGTSRTPVMIFNEKAVLKLGRGLTTTGRLNEEGVGMAMEVMSRFHAIARAMDADPFEILATAAVRDASNGPEFVEALRHYMPGVPIRILSGTEEADYSATGVLCSVPDADGLVADIGGGSLELIRMEHGVRHEAISLPLGVIRLNDRSGGDLGVARTLVEQDLATVGWLKAMEGKPLYLVGGAFRALARLQIARVAYPLNIVHLYTLGLKEAQEMTEWVRGAPRRTLERLPGAPRKRLDDAPFAATVLRRLLRVGQPPSVVFCVDGLREGWYMDRVATGTPDADPRESVAREMCGRLGRSAVLPPALIDWTAGLFPNADAERDRLRREACWMSDVGSYDHPEYRAEQTYLRILRMQGVAFGHTARAFIALALAIRYESEASQSWLDPSRRLLNEEQFTAAVTLGLALRLAYTVCGGALTLLDGTSLRREADRVVLRLASGRLAVRGEAVRRRLDRLAQSLNLAAEIEEG